MKNTVKSLVLAAVTLLAFFVMSLIACGDGSGTTPPPAHVHQWGDWTVTKDATCTTAGSQTRTCALDPSHKETQVIPIDTNAHDYRYVAGSGTAPTCTEDGNGNEVCSYNSSHIRSGVVIPKLGHNYEWETATRATCSAVGVKNGTCTHDPSHTTTEEIPIDPNAHDWQADPGSVAPTCTTEGSGTIVCSYNAEHTQTGSVIPALGHDSGEWHTTLAATCTATGTRQLRCTRDNAVLDTETIDALGHNYANWTQTTAPTCIAAGIETGTCTHDATHTTTRAVPIDPDAHDWKNNYTQTTAPTCTTAGIETDTCNHNEAHTRTRTRAALGHDSGEWHTTLAATCIATGTKQLRCTRDNAVLNTETIPALGYMGHTYVNGICAVCHSIEMVTVAGGSFQMGTASGGEDRERPVHTVTLTGFTMSKYEVTQDLYQAVMGTNPSSDSSNPASGEVQGKRPVEMVNWYNALVFCNTLSIKEGLSPVYSINGSTDTATWGSVPTSSDSTWNSVQIVEGSTGYRLPTEAQWEYAAKGGNGSPGNYTYAGSDTVGDVAWYGNNSGYKTHEVGKKSPNGLGLYDMSGNVYEWCWDWLGNYSSTPQTDPTGASSGALRVLRGGCLENSAENLRSAYRHDHYPNFRNSAFGFRLVRP